jgi:hypothetical protein
LEKKQRQKKKKEQSKAREDTENEPEETNIKNVSDSEGFLSQLKFEAAGIRNGTRFLWQVPSYQYSPPIWRSF